MYIKKRKRKIPTEQKFTVVAKDEPSLEIIKQKAGQKAIEIRPRGHAKNQLCFHCEQDKAGLFLKEISDLCFRELPVTLPNSILRPYRRELLKTAVNRLDKNAAEAALKLLTEQKADNGSPEAAAQTDGETSGTVLNDKAAVGIKQSPKFSIQESIIRVVKTGINWVRSFTKPKSTVAAIQK